MTSARTVLPVLAAAFLSVSCPAQTPTAQTPPVPAADYCGAGYGNGIMGFLTPEQRLMHFDEMRQATAAMSLADMRSYRWDFRAKVMAMSPAERTKFASDLSAKWNALPADRREQIRSDFLAYRGSGRWSMGPGRGMGRGWGMGRGRGMGGCWW